MGRRRVKAGEVRANRVFIKGETNNINSVETLQTTPSNTVKQRYSSVISDFIYS